MVYSYHGLNVYYYGDAQLESQTDLRSKYGRPQLYPDILEEQNGRAFEDPEFPHNDQSIGDIDDLLDVADSHMADMVADWRRQGWNGSATWVRIKELCKIKYKGENQVCFDCGDIGKSSGRLDIQQGLTGDCWFLCSLSAVSMEKNLINTVIPSDNCTNDSGVYHFRFWYQGSWVDIVVDDFIPCFVVGKEYNIVGSKFYLNNGKAEFWAMLVEKAFAKLNGCYSNIAANVCMYALESLTGGFGECIMFREGVPDNLFQELLNWLGKDSVICAGTKDRGSRGIIGNHAYSVTGATTLDVNKHGRNTSVELVRLRNPWGNTEWNGDWSDDSPTWRTVSQAEKDELGLVKKDDGEFWMSFDDLVKHYGDLSSCTYFDLSVLNEQDSKLRYSQVYDEWSRNKNTDGGWGKPENNPHYTVEISTDARGTLCALVISVTVQHKLNSELEENAGFCIRVFKASKATTFDQEFFRTHTEKFPNGKDSAPATRMKSFSVGFELKAGRYVIVPTTITAHIEKKLCLRILHQKKSAAH